jgi:hypothetical protein
MMLSLSSFLPERSLTEVVTAEDEPVAASAMEG